MRWSYPLASQMARMAAVGRGDSPAQVLFRIPGGRVLTLPCRSTFRSVCVPVGDETLAQILASIGSPVEAGDSGPSL